MKTQTGEFLIGLMLTATFEELDWQSKRHEPTDIEGLVKVFAKTSEAEKKGISLNLFPLQDPWH
ncbi:MAG: hypothetical protein A3C85_04455 [Candidatus Doudnabacteria bacterium RIFCSPHIGHO2_02_FULL_48_21]|uniref:Uncharacterized protein n=1 Tax=Candidatus Doudnabacteria bacterium RIFCSPLOWO2_02_FULL_48_13 TaxID=1817845 RepID=A0A1F5QCJ4_9BACT|nr:MAG: hypothetical protein A3K05_00610 [Candidatus Doudnabacteria bacterium RIFCSPHIGHO2_01_48_18]OGE79666.1 MAG: hypothetical protein A2668_01040 [Candidatus Doudnabacteria bacterium RIFCSPHIGHO2_01_FULL_48_180]OGE91466.1 MAG: hypothetical protein A3F44_01240 [Candidatus Doudnabacteria bacterium RIFCSPHIGHO2_12_FULL_47_25]OGE93081.1 MAG: hypothetical protein A3C85_04455 [Candidatus Doudnabacteria bacterium RIFCSPHIGHO2_02_FULL_48_21]OGE98088.1 MAG: hypothetical protein A3A83_02420 [Candidatu